MNTLFKITWIIGMILTTLGFAMSLSWSDSILFRGLISAELIVMVCIGGFYFINPVLIEWKK